MPKAQIQVLVDHEVLAEIDRIAAQDATSRSATTRRLILRALGR